MGRLAQLKSRSKKNGKKLLDKTGQDSRVRYFNNFKEVQPWVNQNANSLNSARVFVALPISMNFRR